VREWLSPLASDSLNIPFLGSGEKSSSNKDLA
jgi:hypothetical protein